MTVTAQDNPQPTPPPARSGRRLWLILGALVGVAACIVGLLSVSTTVATTTSTEETEFPAPRLLEIDNDTEGSVTLVAKDTDTVTVSVSAWESLTADTVRDAKPDADLLRLSATCDRLLELVGRCAADYVVTVPAGTEVSVRAVTGKVDVTGVAAPVKAVTGTGRINLRDITGAITVESAIGDVTATGSGPSAKVTTNTGNITLDDFQAKTVTATSETGKVRVGSGFTTATLRSNTSAVRVKTGTEFEILYVATTLGNIDLTVPDVAYRVDADSTIGDVRVNVDQSRDAAAAIEARSDSGVITINPR